MAILSRPRIEDPDVLITPSPELRSAAAGVVRAIDGAEGEPIRLQVGHGVVTIPDGLVLAIKRLCRYLAEDMPVTVVPFEDELTTQAAANMLGISRTRLIQLIDRGDLGARREGSHRRLSLRNVLAYRRERAHRQESARRRIEELASSTESGQNELNEARERSHSSILR